MSWEILYIRDTFFSMFYLFVFRINCWTFHHEDYWKQTLFHLYFLILQESPTNVLLAKNVRSFRRRNMWAISDFFCDWIIFGEAWSEPFQDGALCKKIFNGFKLLTIFGERLHFRCLTWFWIHLCMSCELRGVSWFKFSSWLPIYSSFTKNELVYCFCFQGFVKIRKTVQWFSRIPANGCFCW